MDVNHEKIRLDIMMGTQLNSNNGEHMLNYSPSIWTEETILIQASQPKASYGACAWLLEKVCACTCLCLCPSAHVGKKFVVNTACI